MSADHDALTRALQRVRRRLGADTAAILVLDDSKSHLELVESLGLDRTTRLAARVPLGRGFAGRVAQLREPVVLEHVTADNVINPILHAHRVRSLLGVPLVDQGLLVGVMHVGSRSPRVFTPDEVTVLERAATGVARVIRSLSLDEERTASIVLQRSLLPAAPATVPGLDIAARYLPAEGDLGGDWYDTFVLPGDRLGIVIGDVVGHGLEAAVVMGRLRSALRAYALHHDDPAAVLEHLDRTVHHFEHGALATVLYAVSEPPHDELRIASAGHWPPAVVDASGRPVEHDVEPDVLLGVEPSTVRTSVTLALAPGQVVCLFTDGLVERRDADDPTLAVKRLAAALDPALDAEANVRSAIAELVAQDVIEDDVAVLVLKKDSAG